MNSPVKPSASKKEKLAKALSTLVCLIKGAVIGAVATATTFALVPEAKQVATEYFSPAPEGLEIEVIRIPDMTSIGLAKCTVFPHKHAEHQLIIKDVSGKSAQTYNCYAKK